MITIVALLYVATLLAVFVQSHLKFERGKSVSNTSLILLLNLFQPCFEDGELIVSQI